MLEKLPKFMRRRFRKSGSDILDDYVPAKGESRIVLQSRIIKRQGEVIKELREENRILEASNLQFLAELRKEQSNHRYWKSRAESNTCSRLPWDREEFRGWTIVSMHHFYVGGLRLLYVAIAKNGMYLRGSNSDNHKLFMNLAEKIRQVEKEVSHHGGNDRQGQGLAGVPGLRDLVI